MFLMVLLLLLLLLFDQHMSGEDNGMDDRWC
jgi:hypothetical protein